jgi:type IV pilus assembly protein PilW
MNAFPRTAARGGGFSLVELMVSVVIGLLAVLFATRIMTDNERNKDAALGGANSMQNGMSAMFSINGDVEQAGFGLNDPLLVGCNTIFTDSEGYQLPAATRGAAATAVRPLAPVLIEPGGTGSDRLTTMAGSAAGGTPVLRLNANYNNGSTTLVVDRVPYGFYVGDAIVVAPEVVGADCALAQVARDPNLDPPPGQQQLRIGGAGLRFNNGGLGAQYTGNTARIFDMAGAGAASQPVADNIVLFKAQYGFDRRTSANYTAATSNQVDTWSPTMIDADNNGVIGSPGDYGRIVALRLGIVARSKYPQKPPAGSDCNATTVAPTLFGSAQPSNVAPVPVTLGLAVQGDAVDWKCYTYRVFETVAPLRNAGWRP